MDHSARFVAPSLDVRATATQPSIANQPSCVELTDGRMKGLGYVA